MIKRNYRKSVSWVERHRFGLLLAATMLVLVLPAFSGAGIIRELLFVASMSFLIIQSMIVATTKKSKLLGLRYAVLFIMIVAFWLEPVEVDLPVLDIIRLLLLIFFFLFVTLYLFKFMRKSPAVNQDVIITAVNIYLIMGIVFASLAFLFYKLLPGAYSFPSNITDPAFVNFNYYSFITMTTVGYGDITPRIPQTQTLAYLIAITGQLYVAIIMAFLVGKLLIAADQKQKNKP